MKNGVGVYKIKNLVNNKVYIGSSVHVLKRWCEHIVRLNSKTHHSIYLTNAWHKYGRDNFIFEVLEYCEKEKLVEREQYWMDMYNAYDKNFGYNLRIDAESNRGLPPSKETRIKLSVSNTGLKRSEETKRKIKERIFTKEWRDNISKSQIGKTVSQKTKNLLLSYSAQSKSEETKIKISKSVKESWNKRHEIILTEAPIIVNM